MIEVIKSIIDQLHIESNKSREEIALLLMQTEYGPYMANLDDAEISYLLDLSFNEISKTYMQAMRELAHPVSRRILDIPFGELNANLPMRTRLPEQLK
jgi:vacuolar-type H+-ATPase subunit C/Vma6